MHWMARGLPPWLGCYLSAEFTCATPQSFPQLTVLKAPKYPAQNIPRTPPPPPAWVVLAPGSSISIEPHARHAYLVGARRRVEGPEHRPAAYPEAVGANRRFDTDGWKRAKSCASVSESGPRT